MRDRKTEDILGYPVTVQDRSAVRAQIKGWLDADGPARIFACANPHALQVAATDAPFHHALQNADLLTPDGIGIVIGSRVLGGQIRDRITGHDVFEDTCEMLNASGGSVFFLGSTEAVLDKIKARLPRDYPNLRLAGTYSPPYRPVFSEDDTAAMIAAVEAAAPDVLWVGMTAPKQEKWLEANRDRLPVRFAGAVGAVFDFYAGTVQRSSPTFQRLGLEWLPRLAQEPKRLWRRNFVSSPMFLLRILRARVLGAR